MAKLPKDFKPIPAEYGTIEKRVRLDDGTWQTSTEQIILREAQNFPTDWVTFETRSERILISPSRKETHEGQEVLIPAQYKTITKRVPRLVKNTPPKAAIKLGYFFLKKEVRDALLERIEKEYMDEQLIVLGGFWARTWYFKEVVATITGSIFSSTIGKFLQDIIKAKNK